MNAAIDISTDVIANIIADIIADIMPTLCRHCADIIADNRLAAILTYSGRGVTGFVTASMIINRVCASC